MHSALKWHDGKHYLASRIVKLLPAYLHYVEPYFGSGAVLFAKPAVGSEVVNDLNGRLINLWQVLGSVTDFKRFLYKVQAIPISERLLKESKAVRGRGVDDAVAFFICCRQSLAGRMRDFTPLSKTRLRRDMNGQASAWWTAIDGLEEVHRRLLRVVILNREATKVIQEQDGLQTCFYLDPPYLGETRADSGTYGPFEMDRKQHERLLDLIRGCKAKVLLSGYRSSLYDQRLRLWNRHDFKLANSASGSKTKRIMTECVWCNF